MEKIVYLVIGLLLGTAFGVLITWMKMRQLQAIRPNPASDFVTCSACRSPILGPPLHVVVTDNDAFRYYKCPQCGTAVTTPV